MAANDPSQTKPVQITHVFLFKLHTCNFDSFINLVTYWCVFINVSNYKLLRFWVLSLGNFPASRVLIFCLYNIILHTTTVYYNYDVMYCALGQAQHNIRPYWKCHALVLLLFTNDVVLTYKDICCFKLRC